jgi:translocation and assembly module TamB
MRRFALILTLMFVTVVAVVAGTVHVHTQSEDEQGYVESLVQRLLSAEGRPVTVQGIGIGLTGNVTAERVAVRDEAGEWLVIENFGLDWSPLSLFTDTLRINALTAERMTMLRRPEAAPPAEAPDEAANLIAAQIGRLSIEELDIAAPVAGRPARFTLSGSGSLSAVPPEIRLDLEARRIDEVEGRLVAEIVFEQETSNLDLQLVLTEGRGGLVQQLLALRGGPTVDLRVVGHGPVSDWAGDLRLALDDEPLVSGTARITGSDAGTMIEAQLDGEFTRLVPSEFDELVQGRAELAATVMLDEAGVRIDSAVLRSEVVEISADGLLDFETEEVLFSLSGQLGYAGPVMIADTEILRLAFEARLQGPYDAPEWNMNATAESLGAAGVAGRDLTLEISGSGLPIADQSAQARIIASGDLEPGDSGLPPLLEGRFLTDLSLDLPGDGRVVLENAYAETAAGAVSATGHFMPETGGYELALDAQMRSPETGNPALDRLLQGHTRLVGSTSGVVPEVVRLHDVALTSDVLDARLSGELLAETMDFTASAVVSELRRLDERVAGSVELEATLTGPRDVPQAVFAGRGRELSLMGKAFRDVAFEAAGTLDAEAPTGAVRLTGSLDHRPVDISATLVAADGDGPNIELDATVGSARIEGALAIPAERAPSGRLIVSAPDLSHLGPLLLTELGGALDAEIEIAEEGARSTAVITAQGRDMTFGALAAASVDADLVVEDLFGTPRPRGDLRLAGVRAGAVDLAAVELAAETVGEGRFAVTLQADGPRMNFAARTMTQVQDGAFLVTIEQLSGQLDGNDLALAAPATVILADESIRIDRAEIATGGGRVVVAGALAPRLDARIELSDLPLAMAADFVPDLAPAGILSGTVTLAGSLEAPQARFELAGRDVSVAALRDYGLPPLALQAQGDFAEQHLTFISTARGPEPTELAIGGTVSLRQPNRVDVTVRGRVPSTLAADELARAGVRLDAVLDVDLRVAGPLDAIAVTGAVTTAGATLGDAEGRFIVRDASARIVLADGVARIEQLQGTTGRDGTASITGTIATAAPHEANLAIELQRGTYSDGTLLVTTFDASLTLTGPLAGAPLVAGRVELIGPKLTLSEPLPVALAPLDVRHINAPMGVRRQSADLEARRGDGGGNLALDVQIVVRDRFTVRGRGLDVQLGGQLRLTGTAGNLIATGGFRVRDGRLDLLGQRVVIERGQLDFLGDFDPRISFAAVARRDGFEIELLVSGRATSPEITITSSPMLPQEEALSRLIFGSSLTELSPFQIAQLAAAVATLSGGGDSGGLMAGLGNAIGLDRFEVIQTETGETRVLAGRRITERVSLGVEQGREPGSTRVNIDIEVTERVKLRGSAGSDGTSKAGVFFQTDY